MNLIADLHTHTLASGHAYGTIREMAQAAAERKLPILGVSEHGPGIPGTVRDLSFLPEGHGGAHGKDEVIFMESVHTCCMIYTLALAALDEIAE